MDGHDDARAVVRLIQCSLCSYPLRTPVTLPCGNSLCRECLPPQHIREYISYPAIPSRQIGITCPFPECHKAHALEDCSVNVVLLKVMEAIAKEVERCRSLNGGDTKTSMEEILSWTRASPDSDTGSVDQVEKGHSRTLSGGRLIATYSFAELGELHYTSDVVYHDENEAKDDDAKPDAAILDELRDSTYKEMECHVCYNLMLEPVTTPCGHSFCRKCLVRILDHARLCPVCRRELPILASLEGQPSDKYVVELCEGLCPEHVAARAVAADEEETIAPNGADTSLFICTVAFPGTPNFLHIFEPRYRLMLRRAMAGNGTFGIIAYNERGTPQGELGTTMFMQVGTLVQIEHYQLLPDGRSYVQCRGISRFKVVSYDDLDGYMVARTQLLQDIALFEEERLEAEETSVAALEQSEQVLEILDRLPTTQLHQIAMDFVRRGQAQSARWVTGGIIQAYGEPPEDPATLPFWLASVLPLTDQERYRLLPATSVRERLKITAHWVRRIESQRW